MAIINNAEGGKVNLDTGSQNNQNAFNFGNKQLLELLQSDTETEYKEIGSLYKIKPDDLNKMQEVLGDKTFIRKMGKEDNGYGYNIEQLKNYLESMKGKNWGGLLKMIGETEGAGKLIAVISAIQILLNEIFPDSPITVDGIYEEETKQKIIEFQKLYNENHPDKLIVDGKPGIKTINALLNKKVTHSTNNKESGDIVLKVDENGRKYIEINGNKYFKYERNMNGLGYLKGKDPGTGDLWVYVGEFEKGVFNGKGIAIFESGTRFEGNWKDNLLNGEGTAIFGDGNKYEGNWKDNMPSGEGTATYVDGTRFEGHWEDGLFSGEGTAIYANGDKFEGHWENNEANGKGILTTPNGDKFEGNWKGGSPNGKGTLIVRDGTKYEGNWKDGLPDSDGELCITLKNGQTYSFCGRYYKNGIVDGTLTEKNGNGAVVYEVRVNNKNLEKFDFLRFDLNPLKKSKILN